jgi:adenylate cyclase
MKNLKRFFQELRRRKVFRAIIGYLAVAWLLLQVASVIFPAFELPEFAIKVMVYILALGLMVWIVFSWFYDWTSEGWQRTADLEYLSEGKVPSTRSVGLFALFVVVILGGGFYLWQTIEAKEEREVMSLAVLPFADLSAQADSKALISGLHDNLITSLSQLGTLRVISRTSTLRYADTNKSMKEIAEDLDVDALIEASVLNVGDTVRINIQLIQVFPEEKHLWAEIFDRPFNSNVLSMFNELTETVAGKIHLELSPEEEKKLQVSKSVDPEALKVYLKGKYQLEKLSPEGFELAREYFQKAIEIDPGFAPVYAEIATSYMYMLQMRMLGYGEAMPKVYEYYNKAMEIDQDLPEALYTEIFIKWFEYDWEASEEKFRKFLELYPNHALANSFFTHLLFLTNRKEEALIYSKKAVALDPKNDLVLALNAGAFALNGLLEEAASMQAEAYKLNPRSIFILRAMEGKSFDNKDEAGSIDFLQAIYEGLYGLDINLPKIFEDHGYQAALLNLIEHMVEEMENQDFFIAMYYSRLGMYEEMVAWILKGFENRDVDMHYAVALPGVQDVFKDPRLKHIPVAIGLPAY